MAIVDGERGVNPMAIQDGSLTFRWFLLELSGAHVSSADGHVASARMRAFLGISCSFATASWDWRFRFNCVCHLVHRDLASKTCWNYCEYSRELALDPPADVAVADPVT